MEFEHRSGIYMCTCSCNKKSYIGQAKDVKNRKCEHLSDLRGELNPKYGKEHSGKNMECMVDVISKKANELNRQAHLGAKNKNSKPVICVETGEIFASQGEAGRAKHCDSSTINKCCHGVKQTTGGFHWRYATSEEIESIKHAA